MKELTLKEIQEDVFQILLTFDQFCKNNGSLSNFGVLKCLCTPGEDMH